MDFVALPETIFPLNIMRVSLDSFYTDENPGENDSLIFDMSGRTLGLRFDDGSVVRFTVGGGGGTGDYWNPVELKKKELPTVVRGELRMPNAVGGQRSAVSGLLDASGRKVLALHPGANDVSRLAPGVYFVREPLKPKLQAQAVRKVVLTR
jgi:hypothetical protein